MIKNNCVTLRRFGPFSEGIPLDAVMGKGLGVCIGHFHIARDLHHGCVVDTSGAAPMVYRAMVHEYGGNGFPRIKTLREPKSFMPKTMLIKAFLGMPRGATVRVQGKEVFFFTSVVGTGTAIQYGQEVFVEIEDRQEVSFLFIDGHVRTFKNFDGILGEVAHTPGAILSIRIQDALRRIVHARKKEVEDERMRQVRGVLYGMANLLYFTMCFEEGQTMRINLIRDFFYGVTFAEFTLVRGKLWALMNRFDRSLLPLLSDKAFMRAYSDSAGANVVRIDAPVPPRDAVLSVVDGGDNTKSPHAFENAGSIEKK